MDNNATPTTKRPTLLTVLCIISFVFGGFGLISGLINLTKDPAVEYEKLQAQMEETQAQLGEAGGFAGKMMEESMLMAEKAAANHVPMTIVSLLTTALGLFGVWQMWNLKRKGFSLYVIATVASLAATLFFMGFNMIGIAAVGFAGLISAIFIILYGVNLKHMH